MPNGAKRWCFTLNNPTDDEEQLIGDFGELGHECDYLVVGRERGDGGTPHLQGFVVLKRRRSLAWLRSHLSDRAHYEVSRGTPAQAAEYCKKDGDFDQWGSCPVVTQGRRTDFERYREWVVELDHSPTEREICQEFPSLYLRYRKSLLEIAGHLRPLPNIIGENWVLHGWQGHVRDLIFDEPDDREIHFFVDTEGGVGKSWFCRWAVSVVDGVQVLSVARRDDIAHSIDPSKHIFLIDVPRGSMEFLQYGILEMLKNQMVYSPKYDSAMKILPQKVHVLVFCNEHPDMQAMTSDRYSVHTTFV